ncbi:DUF4238 domain-containing protein [Methylobacterium sp. A54F]
MSLPVGQHFVPRMLLKRFAAPDGRLWAFDKRRPDRGIWQSTPKDLLKERHLYTVTRADGSRDVTVEQALGYVESAAEPVIERVLQRARAGLPPGFSGEDRIAMLLFLYFQMKRVPDFFRNIPLPPGGVEEIIRSGIANWERERGPIPQEERDKHLSPRGMVALEQGVRMQSLLNVSPRIFGTLEARGFAVGVIKQPDRRFVIGSYPMVRFMARSGRTDLGDPSVELWLPLAPDVAIASFGRRGEEQVATIHDPSQIRKVNVEIARQSTTIVSGSRELLRSLTQRFPRE